MKCTVVYEDGYKVDTNDFLRDFPIAYSEEHGWISYIIEY